MSCGECKWFQEVAGIRADGCCLWGLGKLPFWVVAGEKVFVDKGDGALCGAFLTKRSKAINKAKTYTREEQA